MPQVSRQPPSSVQRTTRKDPTQVLLALWGRPHYDVEVRESDEGVWEQWKALPSQSFQFGSWE